MTSIKLKHKIAVRKIRIILSRFFFLLLVTKIKDFSFKKNLLENLFRVVRSGGNSESNFHLRDKCLRMLTGKFDEKGETGMIGVRETERKYECGYQNYINNATLSSLELTSPRLCCALIKFSCVLYHLSRISRCYFSSTSKETSETDA